MQRLPLALRFGAFLCVLTACGTCPRKPAEAPPAAAMPVSVEAPAAAPVAPAAPAAPVVEAPAPDLSGFWAEYWALPKGHAETQRYAFLSEGRFGWLAPVRDAAPVDPLQRSGHFSFEGERLVLQVARERFADGRLVEHAPPLRVELEIGECPDNREAQALDASYVCRSIGGRAFWRRTPQPNEAPADSAPYLQ